MVLYLLRVSPARLRAVHACAGKMYREPFLSFSLFLSFPPSRESWEKARREIVVVEFMGDGWRGSEKVLNREKQINAMLSRPFYQPFNIIGSRVRSLARAPRIASESGPYKGGTLLLCSMPMRITCDFYRANHLFAFALLGLSKESRFLAKVH